MKELFDEILEIIRDCHIDAVYYINGSYCTGNEVEQMQMRQMEKYVSDLSYYKSVALYGGGQYCEKIFSSFKSLNNITCIIDNSASKAKVKKGIPVISIDDFLLNKEKDTEAVIITSWDYHEAFKSELKLVGYGGIIIDLPEWTMEQFPEFKRPIYEYTGRMNYLQINELELLYRHLDGIEKYRVLKKIIYTLCMIKDFLYAEKYIGEMEQLFSEFGESADYRKAINEIKDIMESCARQQGKDVLFIHVVDSLADYIVDDMPWLNEQSRKGIRFTGITVQYPCTHYAINTMFTGKSAFDIEKTTENIEWEDSELLCLIKEKYSVNITSGNNHILQEVEKINENVKAVYPNMLTEVLFEGLSLWRKNNNRNIILMHSCGELHTPFYRVGAGSRLALCGDMTKNQFEQQFQEAKRYTDEELKWYDYFYHLTGMPMIIMGDHGISVEEVYNYFWGVKKDITRGLKETITTAFIINRMMEGTQGEVNGLIPNTKIPQMIKAVLENKVELLENISVDTVELEFPPGYDEGYCRRFMSRGIWGQYEGFIGIRTLDEVYLRSASGRELYFRPNEWRYRNLIENAAYHADIEECRKKLGDAKFPIELFKMDKYKKHLELLEIYDNECYQKIMERVNSL